MNLVVDASLVVSALIDNGPDGQWAEEVLIGGNLCAPHLMPVEVANILRRAALAGDISQDSATLAHQALHSFRCELFDYELLAERVWALRANVTAYDACYIALAEILDAELATLDRALSRASGTFARRSGSGHEIASDRLGRSPGQNVSGRMPPDASP